VCGAHEPRLSLSLLFICVTLTLPSPFTFINSVLPPNISSVTARCSYGDPGGLQVRACCFTTYASGLLDAPQRPPSFPSAMTCCFFSSLKTLLMLTEAIGPLARVNGFIVDRFSGDPHWPVLGDH
jgi:hypothetical protein